MKPKGVMKRKAPTTVGWAVTGLIAVWLIGVGFWYKRNMAPVSAATVHKVIIIESGESVGEIADSLKQHNLIRNATAFKLYLSLHGLRSRLQTGAYELQSSMSSATIAKLITTGQVSQQQMTIPEGFTINAIKARAARFGIKPADFDTALAREYPDTLAASRPSGTSYEGYLFPDTYSITPATTAQGLVSTMLHRFDAKVDADLIAGFKAQGLDVYQGVTLASMVEKEVSNPSDRALVAGVFLNRLKIGMKLQSDVTVDYGAELLGKSFSTSLNSPYNTYVVAALPVGPICNPGLEAMNAVAHPTASGYYYFLAGRDGKTHFAVTAAEHEANVKRYLR